MSKFKPRSGLPPCSPPLPSPPPASLGPSLLLLLLLPRSLAQGPQLGQSRSRVQPGARRRPLALCPLQPESDPGWELRGQRGSWALNQRVRACPQPEDYLEDMEVKDRRGTRAWGWGRGMSERSSPGRCPCSQQGARSQNVARAKSREAGPSSQETLVGRRGLVRKGSQGEGGGPFVGIQVF